MLKLRLLRETEAPNPRYFEGLTLANCSMVGKVRPWDPDCTDYIVYSDGDLILVTLEGQD